MKTEVSKHWIWGNKSEQENKVEAKCLVVVQSLKYLLNINWKKFYLIPKTNQMQSYWLISILVSRKPRKEKHNGKINPIGGPLGKQLLF
jgi:hypothetical protein